MSQGLNNTLLTNIGNIANNDKEWKVHSKQIQF